MIIKHKTQLKKKNIFCRDGERFSGLKDLKSI